MYLSIKFSLRSNNFCNSIEIKAKTSIDCSKLCKSYYEIIWIFCIFCQIERAMLIKIILDLFTKGFLRFSLTTFSKLFRLLSFFERLEAFTINNFTHFAVTIKNFKYLFESVSLMKTRLHCGFDFWINGIFYLCFYFLFML